MSCGKLFIKNNTGSDRVKRFEHAVIVEFPLRGEWMAPTTPATKVPSHGIDILGETYAYDFVQVDHRRKGKPFYPTSLLRYFFFGVPLRKTYGWGENVYAPCDGVIVKAVDGYPERARAHVLTDTLIAFKNALAFNPAKDDIRTVAGNYLIIKCDQNVYAAFAHLKKGSITVAVGQSVKKGDLLGKVGHSGNSTAPHLHFQLMDRDDLRTAKGIPCAFESIELFQNGQWKTVYRAAPSRKDRFRFLK